MLNKKQNIIIHIKIIINRNIINIEIDIKNFFNKEQHLKQHYKAKSKILWKKLVNHY